MAFKLRSKACFKICLVLINKSNAIFGLAYVQLVRQFVLENYVYLLTK